MKCKTLTLDKIAPFFFQQNVDPARRDLSFRKKPLVVAGKVYEKGIGLRCDGHTSWDLHGTVETLTLVMGVDDESKSDQALLKLTDQDTGELIGKEYRIERGKAPRKIVWQLKGVKKVRLDWACPEGAKGFVSLDLFDFEFAFHGKVPEASFPH